MINKLVKSQTVGRKWTTQNQRTVNTHSSSHTSLYCNCVSWTMVGATRMRGWLQPFKVPQMSPSLIWKWGRVASIFEVNVTGRLRGLIENPTLSQLCSPGIASHSSTYPPKNSCLKYLFIFYSQRYYCLYPKRFLRIWLNAVPLWLIASFFLLIAV